MAKGKANSAGAMIRRYNEQALADVSKNYVIYKNWKNKTDLFQSKRM